MEDRTRKLNRDQLARPLSTDAEDARAQAMRELLLLAPPVSTDTSDPSAQQAPASNKTVALPFRTIGDCLLDPEATVASITALKDHARKLVKHSENEAAQEAATALYYAAIASALVRHGEKITELSAAQLLTGFARLRAEPWLPDTLHDLFEKARSLCERMPPPDQQPTI